MRNALTALREVLVDPETFFAERRIGLSPGHAVMVVLVVSLALTAGVGAIGWLVTEQVDATRTVTVVEPVPNATCESFKEMNESSDGPAVTPPGCGIDEPKTRQVDLGDELWEAIAGQLPLVFVAGIVGWLLVGGILHGVSALASGEGSFLKTLSVAGWGFLPTVFQVAVGVTLAFAVIPEMSFTGSPEAVAEQLRQLATGQFRLGVALLGLVGTAWQAYIWRGGLCHARNLDRRAATGVAAIVAFVLFLFTLG
jgi:hypothetical protein